MKPIEQNEIYDHISQFLKNRGIELKNGSYANSIQKGCSFLADAINLSQKGLERAKTGIDERLDQVRQVIHEKTAPRNPSPPPRTAASPSQPTAKARPSRPAQKARRKPRSTNRRSKGA